MWTQETAMLPPSNVISGLSRHILKFIDPLKSLYVGALESKPIQRISWPVV